jgi:peptidoglycan/LPS O-acetylase OafA/YrhL
MKSDDNRLASLDGWRAVAIVLVLLSHWWGTQGADQIPAWLGPFRSHGDLGVRIFLVISGLLITFLLLKEEEGRGQISLKLFYIRRAIKIFPVYFTFLGVLAVMSVLGYYHDELSTWIGALTFTRNVIGKGDSATGHLWSLAVEEQFYLLWPACLVGFGLAKRPRAALCIFGVVVVGAFVAKAITCTGYGFVCGRLLGEKSLFRYMDSLAIGCAAAFVLWHERARIPAWGFWPAAIALVFSSALTQSAAVTTLQSGLAAIAILCSIIAAPPILNNKPVVLLGVLSYSIYIWHMLFVAHYTKAGNNTLLDWRFWFIPAIGVASASYYFLERPLNSLRRNFSP